MSPRKGAAPGPLAAYVLHQYDWSETSLIVELFTRDRGRVVVAAKGAKRPYSQLRAVLLPFQRITVLLGRAPADEAAEVLNLRGAEWAGGVPAVRDGGLYSGFYMNELLLKLLARQDPHPVLFDAYADTLGALADEAAALRAFELILLRELGVLPQLDLTTQTAQPLQADQGYGLQAEAGLVVERDGVPGAAWSAIEQALADRHADALRRACSPVAQGLRAPLRALLHYHAGSAVARTRQLMQDVQRLTDLSGPKR